MATLRGTVIDRDTGEPIPYISVILGNHVSVADNNGQFAFRDIKQGKYPLKIRHQSYRPVTEVFDLNKDDMSIRIKCDRATL